MSLAKLEWQSVSNESGESLGLWYMIYYRHRIREAVARLQRILRCCLW